MTQLTKTMIENFKSYITEKYKEFKIEFGTNEVAERIYKKFTDKLELIEYQIENNSNMASEVQNNFYSLQRAAKRFLSLKINNN